MRGSLESIMKRRRKALKDINERDTTEEGRLAALDFAEFELRIMADIAGSLERVATALETKLPGGIDILPDRS